MMVQFLQGKIMQVRDKYRCGVKLNTHDKENQIACSHQGGRHSSCKCLAAGNACSSSCGCKGCGNPHGVRPSNLGKRKREQHLWQKLTVSNKKFAMDRGEILVQGVWSEFENIVYFTTLYWIKPTALWYFFTGPCLQFCREICKCTILHLVYHQMLYLESKVTYN